MFINIHGRNGKWNNNKYLWLREHFTDEEIYSPQNDYGNAHPEDIIEDLEKQIGKAKAENKKIRILATSMGAFFADILNIRYPEITTVMVNPSFLPFVNLRGDDEVPLDICREYTALFGSYVLNGLSDRKHLYIVCAVDDEVIDHKKYTRPFLPPGFENISFTKGGHRLDIFDEKLTRTLLPLFGANQPH